MFLLPGIWNWLLMPKSVAMFIEMVKGSQVNGSLEHHPDGEADIKPLIAKVTAGTVIEHG